jgi:hypothetical protein
MKPPNIKNLGNGRLDGATTLRCTTPLVTSPIASALWEYHFAFSRKVTRWKFTSLPWCIHAALLHHCHFPSPMRSALRFRFIDASATPYSKGHPLPPRFQHNRSALNHPRSSLLPLLDSFLQCPPSPLPRSPPHRSAMAMPLTRSPTLLTKVGAPFRQVDIGSEV